MVGRRPGGGPGPVECAHCIHEPGEGEEASAGWLGRQIWACRCHSTEYKVQLCKPANASPAPYTNLAQRVRLHEAGHYGGIIVEVDKESTC